MSIDETLRAVDGLLGPRGSSFLAEDVVLFDVFGDREHRGPRAVWDRLSPVAGSARKDVRITLDAGRAAAEWIDAGPRAAVFEVEDATVRVVRLYEDPRSAITRDPLPLTAREREVAMLVARGLSNREVAEQLVVSVRTIDYHLRNVFVKAGVRSRTELAALMWEQE
jgi:DNA-binding CsgD family transcriptional regulator